MRCFCLYFQVFLCNNFLENGVTEYRIGFRHSVNSSEDAKSELVKLFQEVWEREEGICSMGDLPPIVKYAEENL